MKTFRRILILFWVAALGLSACAANQPILIGFSAQLTGRQGELGVASRNGAELAVEEINANGGIGGRQIKLIIVDDKGEAETARQVDADLVKQGVVAIIGHPTSEQTAAVFDQMNQAGVVMLSSTSSSSKFTGQDDFFFRVIPSNDFMGKAMGQHIFAQENIRKIAGVYDLNNQAFTETLWHTIQGEFQRLGGDARLEYPFKSGEVDLKSFAQEIIAEKPDAIVFMAAAVDVALMSQYVRQNGYEGRLFSSPWGHTKELIEKGGQAVNGIEIVAVYNPSHPSTAYAQFSEAFEARYGRAPTLGASHSYEAVYVLARALEQTDGKAEGLPAALKTINNFPGLQGNITIDPYGDVLRELYIVRVENGQFNIIETMKPNP